jgi:hypothetical protein
MKHLSVGIAALAFGAANAQLNLPWAQRWHPTAAGDDFGRAICSDKFGNFFVEGRVARMSEIRRLA